MNISDFDQFFAKTKTSIIDQISEVNFTHDSFVVTKNSLEQTFSKKTDINSSIPAVYVFEISNPSVSLVTELKDTYISCKNDSGRSAIGENNNKDKKTLYVGKVRKGLRTRLNTHFGLANKTKTQGLRLLNWLPEDVSITCHCYYITNLKDDFLVDMFEEYLKRELKPILGMK